MVYIAVYFYIESPDKKSNKKNKTKFVDPKLKKALVDKGIYDVAAETVGECIKTGNYKKCYAYGSYKANVIVSQN